MHTVTASHDMTVGEGLAASLKKATAGLHAQVDSGVTSSQPFASPEHYAHFLAMQCRFFHLSSELYRHPVLTRWMPGLAERDRLEKVMADCRDLGLDPQQLTEDTPPPAAPAADDPAALARAVGWLYVNEGSNLGAAFLYQHAKELGFDERCGARHLAPHAEGRGTYWRRFVQQLDSLPLNEAAREHAHEGARHAFQSVLKLLKAHPASA